MEIESDKKYASLGRYLIIRSLGSGFNSKVKLAFDKETHKTYAIKILKDGFTKYLQNEIQTLDKIHHPHMVNMIDFISKGEYVKKSGEVKKVTAIVLELAEGGEMFEFLFQTGRFAEDISRYYFRQVLDCLAHMHKEGYTHRDLKPENILFTHDFKLKLADFGFSTLIAGKAGTGMLTTYLGTRAYMAPEIIKKVPYSGTAVDTFALGVILFIMFAGSPPFNEAQSSDPYYNLIIGKKFDYFWYVHTKSKGNTSFFPAEFKDLINKMLAYEPAERPSVEAIVAHPWVAGPVPTDQAVEDEMKKRHFAVREAAEKERERKQKIAKGKKPTHEGGNMMEYPKTKGARDNLTDSLKDLESQFPSLALKRTIVRYGNKIDAELPSTLLAGDYLIPENIHDSLLALVHTLQDQKYEQIKLSEKSYKVTAEIEVENLKVKFAARLFKNDDVSSIITFERLEGSSVKFHDMIKTLEGGLNKITQ